VGSGEVWHRQLRGSGLRLDLNKLTRGSRSGAAYATTSSERPAASSRLRSAVANTVLTLRVEEPLTSHAGSVTQARGYRVENPRAYFRSVDTCSNISGRAVVIAVGSDVNDLRTVAVLAIEERWSPRVTMTCT
jgi:hypothetical protein